MAKAAAKKQVPILVDEDTYHACAGACPWDTSLEPIKVKGKEEAVPIFRPQQRGEARAV